MFLGSFVAIFSIFFTVGLLIYGIVFKKAGCVIVCGLFVFIYLFFLIRFFICYVDLRNTYISI